MAEELLACVEVEPQGEARHAVIWLHGLGADGFDFPPIVPHLALPAELGVRFVFPHAPAIPVTVNGGMVMPAWYDIVELDLERRHDEAGVRASARRLERLMAREVERGIPPERTVLAGFSQGGAIALHVALRHPERLAGAIGLSTYLVLQETLEAERSSASRGLRVFQAHGTQDPMVPLQAGQASRARLEELGCEVEWHTYPMQHEVSLDELHALGRWLVKRLS